MQYNKKTNKNNYVALCIHKQKTNSYTATIPYSYINQIMCTYFNNIANYSTNTGPLYPEAQGNCLFCFSSYNNPV